MSESIRGKSIQSSSQSQQSAHQTFRDLSSKAEFTNQSIILNYTYVFVQAQSL